MRRHVEAAVLAAGLILSACATRGADPDERPEPVQTAMLEVRNYNWSNIHVYLVAGGQRFSLGLVTSNTVREFELPRTAFATTRNLVFIADPVGSVVAHVSPSVHVQPGDRVEWRLQNNLALSSISVF